MKRNGFHFALLTGPHAGSRIAGSWKAFHALSDDDKIEIEAIAIRHVPQLLGTDEEKADGCTEMCRELTAWGIAHGFPQA